MGYSAGMLRHRVEILKRVQKDGKYGKNSGTVTYESQGCVWADVTWSKGVKSMREGALDAYDTIMVRMRWNNVVNRNSYLRYDGLVYQIQSFHADYQDNTVQITAMEIVEK